MFDPSHDWLPLGSVVALKGAEHLVMVVGFMAIDGETGKVWDYVACPYPEGKCSQDDLFFAREMVDEVFQMGYCDAEGLALIEHLETIDQQNKQAN